MKNGVLWIEHFLTELLKIKYHNYVFFFLPLIGLFFTVLYVQIFREGKLGRGISSILYSVSRKKGVIPSDKIYSHIITSILTIGFGGSVGLEAPIVVTGSAIGSNVATFLHLTSKERILLLACGTAAGVAAIFSAPVAGVIFAMEVLLLELTVPAFIPLLISSASATVIAKILHSKPLFHLIIGGWELKALPFYILLGVFCGAIAVYVSKVTLKTEAFMKPKKGVYKKALLGGLVLGILIFLFPPLYGEGYNTVNLLLKGQYELMAKGFMGFPFIKAPWFLLVFTAALILVKGYATALTLGSGGNGGIFATSLMTGALAGFFYSFGINTIGSFHLNQTNFIAVAMAGLLSGVIHAPLTSIFLIAEITGGYVLFVPLMLVCAVSYFFARYFSPYTIYTKVLAEKGQLLDKNKDKTVLSLMDMRKVLEYDFVPIKANQCLRDIAKAIATSKRDIFPVLSEDKKLEGIIHLNQVRFLIFEVDKYDCVFVKDLMQKDFAYANIGEDMETVMKKFEDNKVLNLPVLENGVYKGFISKNAIFAIYRSLLIEESKPLSNF